MPIDVILDTDIGGDIDDTWALGLLLQCPELRTRLVLSCTADTRYRTALAAKCLEAFGRPDLPLGIGPRAASDGDRERQRGWLGDYRLETYPGPLFRDGLQRAEELLAELPEPTVIGIGPLTNLAELCRRRPDLVARCKLVAMCGSIRRRHNGAAGCIAEFNVVRDIEAARTVFAAPWRRLTITPLDTCGTVRFDAAEYECIRGSQQRIPRTIAANYAAWCDHLKIPEAERGASSILYDTVAVALAFTRKFFVMKRLMLAIDRQGFTRIDPAGRSMSRCAGGRGGRSAGF